MNEIVYAKYDGEKGASTVKMNTKWGVFTRTVNLQDEDMDIANKWDGCEFAHYLCQVDMHKAKAVAFKQRATGVKQALDSLKNSNRCDAKTEAQLQKLIDNMLNESDKNRVIAKTMRKRYLDFVDLHLERRRQFHKKYNTQENK